jgi:competence protein ComEC
MVAYNVRAKLLSIFTKIGLSGDELGVTSALIIGDKTYLDDDIRQAYVASGTMHILAGCDIFLCISLMFENEKFIIITL